MHCSKCHGKDGKGGAARALFPETPDFTDAGWHKKRTDAQLLSAILNGKDPGMPAWKDKLDQKRAQSLVEHVRAFSPTKKEKGKDSSASFEDSFRRLEKQFEELGKDLRTLAETPGPAAARVEKKPTAVDKKATPAADARASMARPPPTAEALFLKRCAKCHGANGSGDAARKRFPGIPDFTDGSWQAQQDDAKLAASILEGKGKGMPAWTEKINNHQAKALVAYIRTLYPSRKSPEQGGVLPGNSGETVVSPETEESARKEASGAGEHSEPESPAGTCLAKLHAWLARLHPPPVSFPIALFFPGGDHEHNGSRRRLGNYSVGLRRHDTLRRLGYFAQPVANNPQSSYDRRPLPRVLRKEGECSCRQPLLRFKELRSWVTEGRCSTNLDETLRLWCTTH
jgi:mono/diheme cytochrome c family protein